MELKAIKSSFYKNLLLTKELAVKDIKMRYAGSVLGLFWMMLTPAYQIILYTIVFNLILRVRFDEHGTTTSFVLYLLAGLIPWNFFNETVVRGGSCFIENAHLIKKMNYPIEVSLFAVILSSMTSFLIYLCMYVAILIIVNGFNPIRLIYATIPFLIQFIGMIGLSFGLASITVFFRDITHGMGMILNLIFFITPIMYPPTLIPEQLRGYFYINPLYSIVEMYRAVFLKEGVPDITIAVYPCLFATVVFFIGYLFFRKTKEAIKDLL